MNKKIPMPNGMDKKEIVDLLLKEEYGYLPPCPQNIIATEVERDEMFCAGKAILHKIELKCNILGDKSFTFPVYYTERIADRPSPCFVHINFRDNVPDKYQPTEEIIDKGYSVLSFCYNDVTTDDGDFTNGLAGVIYSDGNRDEHQCGKIGLWAWAAMRVVDYAMTLPEIDHEHICVAGHSRLGKTALLTGMLDERVYCAHSNCSGCSGAAISRDNDGETIAVICDVFPYWFAKSYQKYVNNEDNLPFDQHFLIAANMPHRVHVSSAVMDLWADPKNEYLACYLAQDYYNEHNLKTSLPENMPDVGCSVNGGYIGYSIRENKHYFSRADWLDLINYLENSK